LTPRLARPTKDHRASWRKSGDLNTIGDTLGHASIAITMLYAKRASVPKISRLLTQFDLSTDT
jgi:hypothetical protein